MPVHDARAVANFLLDYADEKKAEITLMALLKIIFYAHGWHLSLKGRPLVAQAFKAWDYGPVLRSVWEAFKGSGKRPLATRAKRFDVITNSHTEAREPMAEEQASFLRQIFDAYCHIDAFDLSAATHVAGSPWDKIWNAPGGEVNPGMRISNDEIRNWFLAKQAPSFLH